MPQFEKSTSAPIAPLLKFLREEFGDLTAKVNAMIADGKVSYSRTLKKFDQLKFQFIFYPKILPILEKSNMFLSYA